MHIIRIEGPDRSGRKICRHTVGGVWEILRRQEIRSDCDETFRSELISNCANPWRKSEDLMDHDNHGRPGLSLGINNPRANTIGTCRNHYPFTMSR
jgi:hypothetical protein